jgi:hypothetical protein
MVDCGCATPDEAFEGLEDGHRVTSVEERLRETGGERPPD